MRLRRIGEVLCVEERVGFADPHLAENADLKVWNAERSIWVVLQALPSGVRQLGSDPPLPLALQDPLKLGHMPRRQRHLAPSRARGIGFRRMQIVGSPDHMLPSAS